MPTNVRGKTFYKESDFKGIKETSTPVKGLKCPDCHAQGFKTDKPGVAVCGDYPGWYFLYEQDTQNGEKKTRLQLVNGEVQEMPVFKTKTITNHP